MRLIRFAFWALYNPLAWMYDWVSKVVSLGHWHDWQREALPELWGTRILELAFGTGDMLLDLAVMHCRAVGLELSPQMVRIAGQKLHHRGALVPVVRGRTERLPFADASFDSVLSTFPSEFIVDPDTLREISRVLCPGGRAVIVAMAQLTSERRNVWVRFLEWLYRITGQRDPLPELGPQLAAFDLQYRPMWKATTNGAVLLLVLQRYL